MFDRRSSRTARFPVRDRTSDPASVGSNWVEREWRHKFEVEARSERIAIIPVRGEVVRSRFLKLSAAMRILPEAAIRSDSTSARDPAPLR